jgi:hypothetical protein
MSDIDFNWFRIDHSTGTPILMYKDCSVIESEVAELVMQLIANHRTQPPAEAKPTDSEGQALDGGTEAYVAEAMNADGKVLAKQLYFERQKARDFCSAFLERGYHTVQVRPLVDPARTNNADLLVGAAYMTAAEVCKKLESDLIELAASGFEHSIHDALEECAARISALTPADAKAALEEFAVDMVKRGMSYEEANHEAGTGEMDEAARAIVHQVMQEVGK